MNTASASSNADQIDYWDAIAGPRWVKNQRVLARLLAPLRDELLTATAVGPSERVAEIGCGCGDLTLAIAQRAGVTGSVLAIDVSRPMLAYAAARPQPADSAPIDWRRVDAAVLEGGHDHDILVSQFGVMFFADKPATFANLRRVLKPRGRFAFLAWRSRSCVEWMQAPLDWISSVIDRPAPSDGQIGPFALADGDQTCDVLKAAGFKDVACRRIDHRLIVGETIAEAETLLRDNGPAAAAMRDAPNCDEAYALLRARLVEHAVDDRVVLGAACWLFTGHA